MNLNDKQSKKKTKQRIIYGSIAVVVALGMVFSATVVFFDYLTWEDGGRAPSGVVAVVNDEEIDREEFEMYYQNMKSMYEMQGIDVEDEEGLRRQLQEQILSELISSALIIQEAEKEGLTVSQEEVQDNYQEILANYESQDQLEEELSYFNMTLDDLKDNVRDNLLIEKYRSFYKQEKVDEEELIVSQEELEERYEQHKLYQEEMPAFEEFEEELKDELKEEKLERSLANYLENLKAESDIEIYL